MYSIELDKWTKLPSLKTGKQSHSSCAFNERYVYVFGAYQHGFLRNTVEVLDMDCLATGWTKVTIREKDMIARYKPAVFQISKKELCILGGQDRKDCHLYTPKTNSF